MSLAVGALVLPACQGTIHITGGPQGVDVIASRGEVSEELAALASESPEAAARLSAVVAREDGATALAWTAATLCGVASGVTAAMGRQHATAEDRETLLATGLGFLGGCAGATLLALVVAPADADYAGVLLAYNAAFPGAPYTSPSLGVWPEDRAGTPPIPVMGRPERIAGKLAELLRAGTLDDATLRRFVAELTREERTAFVELWSLHAAGIPGADRVLYAAIGPRGAALAHASDRPTEEPGGPRFSVTSSVAAQPPLDE